MDDYSARRSAAHVVVTDLSQPELDEEDARHLGSVLRLRAGEVVSATDGHGGLRICRYRSGGLLEPVTEVVLVSPPAPLVTVAFAPIKGERTEWAVQKLTEVGVDRIVLIRTQRSVVRWDDRRAAGHLERLRKVGRAAAMQSRRCLLPEISGLVDLAQVAVGPVCMADPDGGPPDLLRPTVLIGPEGGWAPDEMNAGVPLVRLSTGVLRAETAAVAAGVLLVALRSGVVSGSG